MKYFIKRKNGIYIKCYGFLSFAKNIDKNRNKNRQILLGTKKKSATYAIKTTPKRVVQKTVERTVDLVGKIL